MLQTFEGIVRQGTVRLPPGADFPDGARVYITVIPTLDERQARRKAAIWLAENVGDMLMPGPAVLTRQGSQPAWRFSVMIGSPFDEPRGPLGYVDVDAEAGVVIATPTLAQGLIHNAEHPGGSAPATGN
jgi:hypothetical protein